MRVTIGYIEDESELRENSKYYVCVEEDNNVNAYRYIYPDGSAKMSCWINPEKHGWYKSKATAVNALCRFLEDIPIKF